MKKLISILLVLFMIILCGCTKYNQEDQHIILKKAGFTVIDTMYAHDNGVFTEQYSSEYIVINNNNEIFFLRITTSIRDMKILDDLTLKNIDSIKTNKINK